MHLFEQQALDSLLKEFEDVFLKELSQGLPPKCNIEHHIDRIPSIIPNTIPPYQLSRTEEDEVASQLKEYLRMGHIRHSRSPWGALVLLFKKKRWTLVAMY